MYECLNFDLGRDALKYIVKEYNITKMHIPYYLCDVIRHTLFQEGCKPVFYHIDKNFFPIKDFPKEDFILYPNYWGVNGKNVKKLAGIYPKLIVDNAHAYFDEPCGFACFNAGHKFGFRESQLWLSEETSIKQNHLLSHQKDINLRIENFLELHKKYGESNLLNIDTNSIPYVYPYLAETTTLADNLVKDLKKKGKIIYRFWNPLPENFLEYSFYSRLVPIPVLPYLFD